MSDYVDAAVERMRESPLFPFVGDFVVKTLTDPMASELPRDGEGDRPCDACGGDARVIWRSERWRISTIRPTANPVGLFLETLEHLDMEHFDDELASEFGRITVHLEAAIRSLDDVGRVHVHRWGDGAEHFHLWFQGRPAGQLELYGWGNVIWSQLLEPLPSSVVAANHATVVGLLTESFGGEVVGPT